MQGADDPTVPAEAVSPRPARGSGLDDPTEPVAGDSGRAAGGDEPTLTAGTALAGRYRVVRFLARGGMGEVYEAEDTALHSRVALKTVQPAIVHDPAAMARFRREIQVARTVTHASVCRVFDLDHHDQPGKPRLAFYTMELLVGETLAARLRRGPPAAAEAHRVLADLVAGLGAAHAAGVIHRDLKPANVIVVTDGGRAVITDFGLALPVGAAAPGTRPITTGDGQTQIAGTPAYMSPELVAGAPPSIASDLYALGVVMFELQHGRLPATSTGDTTAREPGGWAAAPGADAAWRDRGWERMTAACLDPEPSRRPASAAAVLAGLRPPPRRWWLAGALAVTAGGAALVLARGHGGSRATPPPPPAPPPPPGFAPGPLTATGGCVYAPAFLDEQTVVYDFSTADVMDVYRLRLGGVPEQLTREPTWEWRALPGLRPDEIVYVVSDLADGTRSRLAARDLTTGVERTIAPQTSPAVAAAGGAYYYVNNEGTRIRRVTASGDEVAITMPADATAQMIVPSPDGTRLAIVGETAATPPRVCVADLATTEVRCLDLPRPRNARPAFAPDGRSLLYANDDGIRRRWLEPATAARDELVVPKVFASGIAVSAAGQVVWSDCAPRGRFRDVSASPPVELPPDDEVGAPVFAATGELAYVRRHRELVVRAPDGQVRQIGQPLHPGSQLSGPAFDATGERLAVTATGDQPGLWVYDARRFTPPVRITDGRNHTDPAWLGDELLFTEWDGEQPVVGRVALDGTPPRTVRRDRLVVGVARDRGEVLLASARETRLDWWDPRSDRLRPGPPALADGLTESYDYALSPDGRWLVLQLGRQGHDLYRLRLDDRGRAVGAAEKVFTAPTAVTMSDAAIDDRGHVVVATIAWRGELHAASTRVP